MTEGIGFAPGTNVRVVEKDSAFFGQEGMVREAIKQGAYIPDIQAGVVFPWSFLEELHRRDAVDPDHYKFPGGIEVRQISAHLTSFGGQALQYIARSTRLDGKNKGDSVENLRKAIAFLNWEIERLEDNGGSGASTHIES